MLLKENALRIEKVSYGLSIRNGKPRHQTVYIFMCECGSEVRSQAQYLERHSGKCVKCAQFNDPFRAAYNELIKTCLRRNKDINITYEDFLKFTKIVRCHYCHSKIQWHPHTKHAGKDILGSRSYKLDRMNNDIGYMKDNCVVCCKRCNEGKSNDFTYEEWYGMTEFLRKNRGI